MSVHFQFEKRIGNLKLIALKMVAVCSSLI